MNQKTIKWGIALVLSACAIGFVWSNYFRYSKAPQQTYEFVFKSSATHDLNPLFEGSKFMFSEKQDVRIDFRSKLHKTTVKTQDTLDWIVYSFDTPQLNITANGEQIGEMDKYVLNEDLKKSALAKIDKTGKIVSMATDSSINPIIDVLWRNVLAQMAVVLPENTSSLPNDWTTTEEEPMGQYQGRWAMDAEKKGTDSAVFLVKEKLGYSRVSGEYGNLGKPAISGRYKAMIKLHKKDNSLQNVVVDDLKNLSFGKDTTARSLIAFTANYVNQTEVAPEAVAEMMALFSHRNYALWGRLDADPSWLKMKEKKCQYILGTETAESLIDSLRKINASGAPWSDGLFQKLQALTFLQPKTCAKLKSTIDEFPPKTIAFGAVLNTLALDDSDESQRQFASIIKKYDDNEDALFEILPLISSMKMPSRQVENAVKDIAFGALPDNITSTAQLAYASIAYRTRTEDPKRSNAIVETLIAKLKGKAQTQQYILAMGNTGSAKSLEELKPFLGDPSVETKGLALSNMRLINQPQVDTILYVVATKDTSQVLKKVALETLNFRSSQTVY